MVTTKPKMSASYKAVFALSIIMIFVGMLGGAGSGSKGAGGGAVFVWGYTVWLMYKRDNKGLVSLYRLFLWWQGIAVAIVVAFSIFDASFLSMSGFARFSVTGLLILGAVLMSISYGLLTYFRHQLLKPYAGEGAAIVDIEILDKFWEQASLELQNSKNEAVWAKAFATNQGVGRSNRSGRTNKSMAYWLNLVGHFNFICMGVNLGVNQKIAGRLEGSLEITLMMSWLQWPEILFCRALMQARRLHLPLLLRHPTLLIFGNAPI